MTRKINECFILKISTWLCSFILCFLSCTIDKVLVSQTHAVSTIQHLLSLPMFLFFVDDISAAITRWNASTPLHSSTLYSSLPSFLALPAIVENVPVIWVYLMLNVFAQYVYQCEGNDRTMREEDRDRERVAETACWNCEESSGGKTEQEKRPACMQLRACVYVVTCLLSLNFLCMHQYI